MELNWDNAEAWEEQVNLGKDSWAEPQWNWDCGFKLDFDGPFIHVSSRFYPPHKNNREGWEGSVAVCLMEDEIFKKEFKASTLDELKDQVESWYKDYCQDFAEKLKGLNV